MDARDYPEAYLPTNERNSNMTNDQDKAMGEIRQRVTRIESRVCRIADFLGARVGNPDKELKVTSAGLQAVTVETPVMDVTLSEIVQFLTQNGIADKVATVKFNGRTVATVTP